MMRILYFFIFLCIGQFAIGQDIHYSQFYNSPLNINPANTGIFNGDHRLNLSYRNQWSSVVPWKTFSASYDRKFFPKRDVNHFFAGGLLFNYDRESSISKISLYNIDLTGSFTKSFNSSNHLTIGAMLGFARRAFDSKSLTWDSQWNGIKFDNTLPSKENFNVNSVNFFESGLGLNYRWQRSSRTKLDLGIGAYHLIEPTANFFQTSDGVKLPRRFSLSGVGSFELAPKFDIQLQALAQFQGNYREYIIGGLGKMYVNQQRGKELEVHLGLGYRTSKSLFPIFALQYKNFYGSINYDIDLSSFADDHRHPSTIEFHFSHIITNVKPFKTVKVCPIY